MVQDTGLGTEVFQALNKQGQVLLFGKEDLADPANVSLWLFRDVSYCVKKGA